MAFCIPLHRFLQSVSERNARSPASAPLQAGHVGFEMHDLIRAIGHSANVKRQRTIDQVADAFNRLPKRRGSAAAKIKDPLCPGRFCQTGKRISRVVSVQEIPSLFARRKPGFRPAINSVIKYPISQCG